MVKGKRCVYSLCPNSAENCEKDVFFLTFPRPKKDLQKCKRWVAACGRYDSDLLKRLEKCTLFICSLHFVGERGPTDDNPDPVPFRETTDTLKLMGIRFHTNLGYGEPSFYTSDVTSDEGNNFAESPADNNNTICLSPIVCQTQPVIKEEISIISGPLKFYASNSDDGNSITESPDNFNTICLSSKEPVIKEEIFQEEILETNSKGTQTQGQEIFTQHDYDSLKVAITSSLIILPNEWSFTITNRNVVLFKSNLRTSSIIISLTVSEESLIPVLKIYGQSLPENHPLLKLLPEFTQVEAIHAAINIFKNYLLCDGIRDAKFKTQFEERDFNKIDGCVSFFTNNLHSKTCDIILRKILRKKSLCLKCSQFKRRLDQQIRKKQQSKDNKERRNCYLSHADLQLKIIEMKR